MRRMKKRKRNGVSIGWKLARQLLLFVVITLSVTWVFQVFLLDAFYENAKHNELERVADALSTVVGTDHLNETLYSYSSEESIGIEVFLVTEDGLKSVADTDEFGESRFFSSNGQIESIFRQTLENDGKYYGKMAFGGKEIEDDRFSIMDREYRGKDRIPAKLIRLICAGIVTGEDGNRYFIVMNTGLTPLQAVVNTLKTQFSWIALILLLLSAIVTVVIYRSISRPLILMTESAKQLADGDYDVHFSETGYRETKELAKTLNYASEELSRADHLQKELVANVSHDLRTPLTMIRGYAEMMRDIPDENAPENMQVIIDETERLSDLVSDLLDLSRFQAGVREPTFEVFDLTGTVTEALKRYDAFVRFKGYDITFEKSENVKINADQRMILQVLYNLINNAINYTGEDKKVEVLQTCEEGIVRISVTDTGEGIAEDQLKKIWERYYKVDKVHRQAAVGTGIGLSIVKEILNQHKATFGVQSRLGYGSTFWFEFPIIRDLSLEE